MSATTAVTLPIIGTAQKNRAGFTAAEPISLAQVARSDWCHSMRTTDGPSSGPGSVTYYLLAEIDGNVLAVTGTAGGAR
ncbi:hypothetical protein [Kitasatospora cineracea]|uniref:Uncharacterized protein n=1 Tax=Kitasatospora cineracea TaxID=88074 RepID=A0A3N4RNG3_9ACTN|nr:hypothetical protein [Kitasatospora cineracea]RPE34942.1 hypothetical protein EDD38_3285 [Kitasatospora cineracea]